MICSLRNFFLFLVVLSVSVSFCLAQTGPITRIEQDDPSIAYSGNWYQNASSSNSGGSAALTNVRGSRAVVTFTGTGISWIGVGDLFNGVATVTLDGKQSSIDAWAESTQYQMVLYTV